LTLLLVLVLASRGFSPGTPVFPSPQKTNISKFQFDLGTVDEGPPCGFATANSHYFILFINDFFKIYFTGRAGFICLLERNKSTV